MLFFHETLRKMLQEKLNENTKNVLFDVSLFFKKHDSAYEKLIKKPNNLRDKVTPFSLLHIEKIDVNRLNLPEHDIVDGVVQSTIMIPTDKKSIFDNINFNNVFGALDEFILKHNAKTLPFGEIEYDLIVGGFKVNYDLGQVRNIGMNLKFKDEENYEIYKSGLNRPNDLIRINKIGKQLQVQLRNTGNDGYNTFLFDIELDKEIEVVIERVSVNVNVYVNGEKRTTTSTTLQFSTQDEFYPYNGTIKEFYTQVTALNINKYEEGILTLEGLFDNPNVKVLDFISLENLAETNDILELVGKITTIGSQGYATFSFDSVTPLGGIFEMFGTDYQEYDFTFGVVLSKDIFMGNQVEYYLDDVRVYPPRKQIAVASENMQEQTINEELSKGVNASSALGGEFTLYYKRDKKVLELINLLKANHKRNTTYELKVVYPTLETVYGVTIGDFAISPLEGEPLNYTFSVDIADEILEE